MRSFLELSPAECTLLFFYSGALLSHHLQALQGNKLFFCCLRFIFFLYQTQILYVFTDSIDFYRNEVWIICMYLWCKCIFSWGNRQKERDPNINHGMVEVRLQTSSIVSWTCSAKTSASVLSLRVLGYIPHTPHDIPISFFPFVLTSSYSSANHYDCDPVILQTTNSFNRALSFYTTNC